MNTRRFSSLQSFVATFAAVLAAGQCLAQDPPVPVIEFGSPWQYFDTGAVPPALGGVASWRAANYNADIAGTPWKTGPGVFGYGDSVTYGTPISFGANPDAKHITTYFWKRFQLPAGAVWTPNATAPGAQFKSFELGIIRDDAVAVYLNGVELFLNESTGIRDNLPNAPNQIINTTLANAPLDGDSETTISRSSYSGQGLLASNVIAIEVHQSANTTPDMRFDMLLNLTDTNPCYGAAKPGIELGFDYPATGVPGGSLIHMRDPLAEPPFDDQDTEMNWKSTDLATGGIVEADWVDGTLLPSNALSIFLAGSITFDSEPIDVRNYKDVVVTAKVQTVRRITTPATNFAGSDKIEFTLRYSGDGGSYRDLPWQTIGTTAAPTGTVWTDVVAENAAKKAIVPTSAADPPANWRTGAYDDAAWPAGTKGAGYENNPGDATNYTSLLDPNFNFQSQLFGANPKKTVTYMRCTFPAQPDRATFTKMQLRMKYDDGFIAFLNDVELTRKNVAASVTTANITPTTLASQGNSDTNAVIYEDFDVTSKLTSVDMAQPNVLAIYVLNDQPTSSDMIAWPVLQLGKPGGPPAITLASLDDGDVETYGTVSTATAGAGGTSLIPPGTQAIKIRWRGTISAPGAENKAYYFDDVEVTGTPIAADSYDSYIRIKAPLNTESELDAKADLDGDSILNILEYGFGSDPIVPALTTMVNNQMRSINPEVIFSDDAFVRVKFRIPSGRITGNAGDGFEVNDLNIRPQMSTGDFTLNGWQDAVIGVSKFVQEGVFEENNDGTVTVTCRSIEPVERAADPIIFVRVRVGVTYPAYLSGKNAECPF